MITQEILDQVAQKELEISEILNRVGIDHIVATQIGISSEEAKKFTWIKNKTWSFSDYEAFKTMFYSLAINTAKTYDASQAYILNDLIKTLSMRLMEISYEEDVE